MKLSNDKFIRWTSEIYKCPNCDQEIHQKDIENRLNEIQIKSSIFIKDVESELRIRCKICKKLSPFSKWKIVEENTVPYEEGDPYNPGDGETLIDGPLYRCPSERINVRPAFAEMCKDCKCRDGVECTMEDTD